MKMNVSMKTKVYTVAMVVLSLGLVLLTGCDVLGAGSIDPEAIGTADIVSEVPTKDADETKVPADNAALPAEDANDAETPGEGSDSAETPGEDAGDTADAEAPAEDSGAPETPAEDTDDAEVPAEDTDDAEAPAEDTDDAEVPAEDNDDDAEAPAEDDGNTGALSTDPANPTLWNAQQVYAQQGYYVSHNGRTYESQWWVQGDEPGAAEWNGWREVNPDGSYVVYIRPGQGNTSDWSETVAYPGANYYVRYNGVTYRSKWYANAGETPGVAAVWEQVE